MKLIELCKRTKYRYGHRKIKTLLKKEHQIELNRNTVQNLMQKHNLQCRIKRKRKWKSQGGQEVIVPNILVRNFFCTKSQREMGNRYHVYSVREHYPLLSNGFRSL